MPLGTGVEVPPDVAQESVAQQKISAGNFWRDPRPTNKNPNFVRDYFQSSRLHFIGSFRARYESMMVAVGKRLNVHPSVLLRPPPKSKSTSERIIVHIDMDCFFASIAVTKNPELRGKCIAICHGGGEISSCSYEARAYGVRAGMFCRDARKLCPDLLNVDYDFPSYEKVSIQIYSFFHDYPGICVEAVSVDEAYLDITETIEKDTSQNSVETLVSNLRNRIEMETGCTASAGIGPSKLVARLATKGAKPNGQLRVRQENVIKYLDTLSVRDLPGIGWRISKRFAARSINTVPQLRALSLTELQEEFGERQGQVFYDLARALDSRPVEPLKPRKSIGAEASWGVRFETDETDKVNKFIKDIAEEVATRVTEAGAYGRKMTFKVYRKIPGSSMKGWKHLGHGPCTILTKSAKLPATFAGDGFKAALKEKCLDIHRAWKIRHDEFRGVGVQVTDLVFADLSFNHSALPVNGTRRIDTFFPTAPEKAKPLAEKQHAVQNEGTQTTKPDVVTNRAGLDNAHILPKDEFLIQTPKPDPERDTAAVSVEKDRIEPVPRKKLEAGNSPTKQVSNEEGLLVSDLPEDWDKQVFQALPRCLQGELLQERNRAFKEHNGLDIGNNGEHLVEDPGQKSRTAKRKPGAQNNRQELRLNERKRRRKQAAQITMTQCADISELKKTGHEVLDAEEFRKRPLREVVELLDDLKPRRKGVRLQGGPSEKNPTTNANVEQDASERDGLANTSRSKFDIPSLPSLSSDSESSYGVSGAIEKQGFEHSRIYADEDIWKYASVLKLWMESNARDIKTGHVELLRGRVLEFVHLKELDRACSELRTIRKFADEDDVALGGWKATFNDLLADVQKESIKLYGFKLGVRPLATARQSHTRL